MRGQRQHKAEPTLQSRRKPDLCHRTTKRTVHPGPEDAQPILPRLHPAHSVPPLEK